MSHGTQLYDEKLDHYKVEFLRVGILEAAQTTMMVIDVIGRDANG